MAEIASGRVERRADGWYEVKEERFTPMLHDIYWRGFLSDWRRTQRRIEDLERRGG